MQFISNNLLSLRFIRHVLLKATVGLGSRACGTPCLPSKC